MWSKTRVFLAKYLNLTLDRKLIKHEHFVVNVKRNVIFLTEKTSVCFNDNALFFTLALGIIMHVHKASLSVRIAAFLKFSTAVF